MAAPVRTTREAWVGQALELLTAGGPDAVRIEVLAKRLGVTKGGFYGLFRGRQALMEEMLDRWETQTIDQVIQQVEGRGGDARARLRRLFGVAASIGNLLDVELAVREWARRNESVAARVRRVDNRRMDYLRNLYGELYDESGEVEARCLLVLTLFVGTNFVAADHPGRSRGDVSADALALLEP